MFDSLPTGRGRLADSRIAVNEQPQGSMAGVQGIFPARESSKGRYAIE
jgi:hypothetical protein